MCIDAIKRIMLVTEMQHAEQPFHSHNRIVYIYIYLVFQMNSLETHFFGANANASRVQLTNTHTDTRLILWQLQLSEAAER